MIESTWGNTYGAVQPYLEFMAPALKFIIWIGIGLTMLGFAISLMQSGGREGRMISSGARLVRSGDRGLPTGRRMAGGRRGREAEVESPERVPRRVRHMTPSGGVYESDQE